MSLLATLDRAGNSVLSRHLKLLIESLDREEPIHDSDALAVMVALAEIRANAPEASPKTVSVYNALLVIDLT